MTIANTIFLLGGLGFFLFGMSLLGEGLKRVAGSKLEIILEKLTSTTFRGVLLGTLVGCLLKKGMPKRLGDTIMQGLGLCVILIGLSGAIKTTDTMCVIICIAVGSLLGSLAQIEKRLDQLGSKAQAVFDKKAEGSARKTR